MTRIIVQRGSSGGSSVNQNRPSSSSFPGSSSARTEPQVTAPQVLPIGEDEEIEEEVPEHVSVDEFFENYENSDNKVMKNDEVAMESFHGDRNEDSSNLNTGIEVYKDNSMGSEQMLRGLDGLRISERDTVKGKNEGSIGNPSLISGSSLPHPPPPPTPPPKPAGTNSNARKYTTGTSDAVRIGSTRRAVAWPVVSTRTSSTESRSSSPRAHGDNEGYNSADEQNPHLASSYDDVERERRFEIDIRRSKGLEVKRMLEDGNCLFRAVGDQVYGDSDAYDLIRQMCMDYMERERDHFSQFITEGFTSYCKRKRRDKVYGNNVEIQALSEMYNRPIHIYSYSTEPINIFHGSYNTDTPPIRLSFHHGNHYNSLVDPRRATIGAGLGFSCLRGTNVGKDQIKAAIKAQQDQQIDNALLAEGRLYSDLELTEKEMERMVMEASRAEYLADDKFKQQLGCRESSTSKAEPSSSGTRSEIRRQDGGISSSMQMLLSMGFSYLQVIEAYSIFGDDADSMVSYLLETGSSNSSGRRKGKATE